MNVSVDPRVLVINLNAPELDRLAVALARSGQLTHFVRPYVSSIFARDVINSNPAMESCDQNPVAQNKMPSTKSARC